LTNCDHPHLRFGTCFDIWRATNATYLLTYLLTYLSPEGFRGRSADSLLRKAVPISWYSRRM